MVMKLIKIFSLLAVLIMATSCGSTKKVSNTTPYGQKLEEETCISLYKKKPTIRAYGMATHFKESAATSLAEAQARAMFARKIEAAVLAATEEVAVSLEQYAGGIADGQSVSDQSAEGNTYGTTIAQQVLHNTHTIETSRYFGDNRQFTVYVCMEYKGTDSELASQIESSVKECISQEDRARIDQRHDKFRERILSVLGQQ